MQFHSRGTQRFWPKRHRLGMTSTSLCSSIGLGVLFFVTSFSLAMMTSHGGTGQTHSLIQEQARKSAAAGSAQPNRGPAPPQNSTLPTTQGVTPARVPAAAPTPAAKPAPTGGH